MVNNALQIEFIVRQMCAILHHKSLNIRELILRYIRIQIFSLFLLKMILTRTIQKKPIRLLMQNYKMLKVKNLLLYQVLTDFWH
jgi:hypothetical protein